MDRSNLPNDSASVLDDPTGIFKYAKKEPMKILMPQLFWEKTLAVLLIEDSPDYVSLVQQWLSLRTDVAFAVHWVDSLRAGLNDLKHREVDVVLLDLGLPDSNGLETFTRIKFQASAVPIIVLTGDNSERLALQTVQDGAQDYIVKGSANGDSVARAIQFAVLRTADRARKTMTEPSDRAAAWWSS